MDNGSQYLSEHFQNQIKFWGIAPSFAFVSQPQTNGVAERFSRTLKEQVIYCRTYRNIEELRVAVTAFMERYNQHWLVEKLGYRIPNQACSDFYNDQQKKQRNSYLVSKVPGALQHLKILVGSYKKKFFVSCFIFPSTTESETCQGLDRL